MSKEYIFPANALIDPEYDYNAGQDMVRYALITLSDEVVAKANLAQDLIQSGGFHSIDIELPDDSVTLINDTVHTTLKKADYDRLMAACDPTNEFALDICDEQITEDGESLDSLKIPADTFHLVVKKHGMFMTALAEDEIPVESKELTL